VGQWKVAKWPHVIGSIFPSILLVVGFFYVDQWWDAMWPSHGLPRGTLGVKTIWLRPKFHQLDLNEQP